jgi:hypothetical protein
MFDESSTDLDASAKEHGESPGRKGLGSNGIGDDSPSDFAGAGMSGMGLDDYRAPGGKCGGGISATDGEGEREVACTEHDHRAKPAKHGAEVGARKRLAIRESRVDAGLHPRALLHDGCEEAELVGGASDFPGEAGERKGCFKVGALGEFVAVRVETVCNTAEKSSARKAAGLRVDGEGFGGEVCGAIKLLQGG